jgi:hypothetical protein
MWICPGGKDGLRRYEYISLDDGRVLGEAKPCRTNGFHVSETLKARPDLMNHF